MSSITGYGVSHNRELRRVQAIASDYAGDKRSLFILREQHSRNSENSGDDPSEVWQNAFDAKMRDLGWEYTADHCMCDDPDRGHEPACGWTKAEPCIK